MENKKNVGRPKSKNPKNIQIKITVTEQENKKLELISNKFGIKKTELLRIFALGTDNKTPNDIFLHQQSFYPFTEQMNNFYSDLENNNLNFNDLQEYKHQDNVTFNEYKQSVESEEQLKKYQNEYKDINIKYFAIKSMEEVFKDKHYLFEDKPKKIKVKDQGFSMKIDNMEFNTIEEAEKYIFENDKQYDKIQNLIHDKNAKVVILYGNNLEILKIIPYC